MYFNIASIRLRVRAMNSRTAAFGAWAFGLVVFVLQPVSLATTPFRYQLPVGKTMTYEVEIVADMGDDIDTLKGNVS